VSAVLLVAAAGVVAALALGDAAILRAALVAVMVVAVALAYDGMRRTAGVRAALTAESAARRNEVAALQREAGRLTTIVEGFEASRAALVAEVDGLRTLVARLELSLAATAFAQVTAAGAASEPATSSTDAQVVHLDDASPAASPGVAVADEDDPAGDDEPMLLWPDLSEAPTVVDLLAWEEQMSLRRAGRVAAVDAPHGSDDEGDELPMAVSAEA